MSIVDKADAPRYMLEQAAGAHLRDAMHRNWLRNQGCFTKAQQTSWHRLAISASSPSRGIPLQPNLVIDRYEIYEAIAKGGMGAVHFGRLVGAEGFGRIVAIKRMHPHLLDEPALANSFLDEARLASRIQHPNVVPIIDVVRSDHELLIVMEYIRGESLAGPLRQHRTQGTLAPIRIIAGIIVQILYGLHAANQSRSKQQENRNNGEIESARRTMRRAAHDGNGN